jgi:hypothetical protein
MRKGVVGRANWAAGRTWSGERGARVVHGGGGGPQERCERNPRSARSRRKGNERAERWWVGEGNVRDKGAGTLAGPAEARWLDDVAFGRE